MKRYFILFISLFLFSCNQAGKNPDIKQPDTKQPVNQQKRIDYLEPDHDTLPNGKRLLDNLDSSLRHYYKEIVGSDTLKGGYITCYGIDDSTKYFYLRHGNTLHLLNQGSIYASTWSLGTLKKDFNTFFMITIDNGNGCPPSFQIFDKKTGRNIPGDKVEAVSYTYLNDTLFMLYDNSSENQKPEEITLFNVSTKRKEFYKLPDGLPDFCDIQIDKLSRKFLKLSFANYVGELFEKTKIYNR